MLETISNLALLNVSFNQLHGQLPSPLNVAPNAFIDLRSNLFEGLIPILVGEIEFLNLSRDGLYGIEEIKSSSMKQLVH